MYHENDSTLSGICSWDSTVPTVNCFSLLWKCHSLPTSLIHRLPTSESLFLPLSRATSTYTSPHVTCHLRQGTSHKSSISPHGMQHVMQGRPSSKQPQPCCPWPSTSCLTPSPQASRKDTPPSQEKSQTSFDDPSPHSPFHQLPRS